jgi:hypothetical protein
MTIEEFIVEVKKRPLPSSRLGRVQTLAKELVEGNIEGVWDNYFLIQVFFQEITYYDDNLTKYLEERWNNDFPPFRALVKIMSAFTSHPSPIISSMMLSVPPFSFRTNAAKVVPLRCSSAIDSKWQAYPHLLICSSNQVSNGTLNLRKISRTPIILSSCWGTKRLNQQLPFRNFNGRWMQKLPSSLSGTMVSRINQVAGLKFRLKLILLCGIRILFV